MSRTVIELALTRYYRGDADPNASALRQLGQYDASRRAEVLELAAQEAEKTLSLFPTDTDWGSAIAGSMEGLADRFRRMAATAGEQISREAAVTPKSFQPGHTYAYDLWRFHCGTVTTHPGTGERSALGWIRVSDGSWTTYAYNADEWNASWVDVTEGGGH